MPNETTIGDDYAAPCPHCHLTMDVGVITRAGKLAPGYVDRCNRCHGQFEIVKIDLIPVVYYKKTEGDNPYEAPKAV